MTWKAAQPRHTRRFCLVSEEDFGEATPGLAILLLAYDAWAAPALMFHVGQLEGATSLEATVLVVPLVGSVVLPLGLLALSRRADPPRARGSRPASGWPDRVS